MSPCRLHVLGRKEELDPERIRRSVVVVLDVLFATSTITTLLAHGARAVIPALGESEALQLAERHPDAILAGEREADPIPSFEAPTPLELLKCGVAGREIIYATTNGTVAARRAAGARAVYAGCLLNGPAVARRLLEHHRAETVLLVCAGSAGRFNLEDFYGAGYLVSLLWEGPWCPTDAAVAAAGLFHNPALTPEEWLLRSAIGRLLAGRGFAHEVRHAANLGALYTLPVLRDGRFVAAGPDFRDAEGTDG